LRGVSLRSQRRRRRLSGSDPIILGHEAAGVVDAVAAEVQGLAPGDHVVLTPVPPCGTCYWCVRGEPGVCVNTAGIQTNTLRDGRTGLSRRGGMVFRGLNVGAFAEYVLTPAAGAVKIPHEIPLDVVCVVGCAVQTGVGAALNTARSHPAPRCSSWGSAESGSASCRRAGGGRSPHHRRRPGCGTPRGRDRLRRHGRRRPSGEDVVTRAMELTGVGVDYAFDAVGRASLVQDGLRATRNGGVTVCVGAGPIDDAITIAPAALFTISEKKLLGCALGSCTRSATSRASSGSGRPGGSIWRGSSRHVGRSPRSTRRWRTCAGAGASARCCLSDAARARDEASS